MNGLALYGQLRSPWPDLKVLFMSGYSENIVTRQNMPADSFNYIQKPFSTQELFAKIREILSQ
jgi:DNA-binding NtrC family response regulator